MYIRFQLARWSLVCVLLCVSLARAQCPLAWVAPPLPDTAAPTIVGEILCSTVWNNTLVVGGTFTSIGGNQFNRIAQWDGTAWRLLGPISGMNGEVRALEVDWNNDLIAGGTFTVAGGVAANRIARFNGTSWSALGSGITTVGGSVNAIERVSFQGTEALYVGGTFVQAGGLTGVNNLVRIDTANIYSVVGTALDNGTLGTVLALHYRTHLWVGGTFEGVWLNTGVLTSPRIARWSLLANSWSNAPVIQGTGVYTISSGFINSQDSIVIGGDFLIQGVRTYLAYNLASGAGLTWGTLSGLNGPIRGLNFPTAVGDFTATTSGVVLNHVARYDGIFDGWTPLGDGVDGNANAVSTLGGATIVAGAFSNAAGSAAPRIAQWDGQSWSRLRSRPTGVVNALTVIGSALYVGGDFEQSTGSGDTAHNIFAIGTGGYSKLETLTGFNGTNGPVNAVVFQNRGPMVGQTALGGAFTQAGGLTASNYATFGTSVWGAPYTYNGEVYAAINFGCTITGCGIVTAGNYSAVNGTSALNIARSGVALGSGLNAPGRALAVYGGNLIVGGSFTTAGGVPASRIAQWNGSTWSTFNGASLNGSVYAMIIWNSQLVVAGSFTQINGQSFNGIARWDGSAWQPFASGLMTSTFDIVRALAVHNGELYAGGTTAVGVRRWTGSSWQRTSNSLNGTVNALASYGGNLWAGGSFTTAGGISVPYLATSRPGGTNPICPPDVNLSGTLTIQDLFDFIVLWFNNDCRADFNQSGVIAIQDVFDFLTAWFAGCP